MLNRRSFLGGLSASLPLLAMPGSLGAQGAPRLHAMIVGINIYTGRDGLGRPVPTLKGCQNDAADIERQVQRFRPATLTRLGWDAATSSERAVTRAEFFSTWERTLGAARSGDTVLLTFAGHGSRVQVSPGNPSGEADGMDDTLVLTGWNASDGRNAEHIIDDELREIFEAADRKGVITCFVADSCHSGTLTRAVDDRAGETSFRYTQPAPVTTREAPPPGVTPPLLPPRLVFLAGAQETETVPEIQDRTTDPPSYRGALSLAFARALAGGAVNGGVITVRSLFVYVRRNARLLSEGVQTPARRPTRVTVHSVTDDTPLFRLPDAESAPPPSITVSPPPLHVVRLRIVGRSASEAERIVRALHNVALVGSGQGEALTWDADRRLVLNSQGHRIAENVGESDLRSVVDARVALDQLIRMAANGIDVQVLINGADTPASDATHKPGDRLGLRISGLQDGDYLTVFNVTGKGEVQMLLPTPYETSASRPNFARPHMRTGTPILGTEKSLPSIVVGAPFGADHVVAVAARRPLSRLMPALHLAHAHPDSSGALIAEIAQAMAALVSESEAQPIRIGLRGIYTWRS